MKQFKKTYWGSAICLVILSGGFQSCKKEVFQADVVSRSTLGREITGTESEAILDDILLFYEYSEEVKAHPGTMPSDLPAYIVPERANAMIENVFNYYFARLDYKLGHDTRTVVVSEGIEVNADGNISTYEVAHAFNQIRQGIKSFYEAQLDINESSKFVLADAEIKIGDEGKAEITVTALVGQDVGPGPDDLGAYPPFDATDKWSVYNKGGRDDGYAYLQWGSPEILTMAVSQDIYPGVQPLKVNVVDFAASTPFGWISSIAPSAAGAPDNPMYLVDNTIWYNTLMHHVVLPDQSNPPPPPYAGHPDLYWVIPPAMDYYRKWINDQVIDHCVLNNKSMVKIKVDFVAPLGGISHFIAGNHVLSQFYAGDDMPTVAVPVTPVNL